MFPAYFSATVSVSRPPYEKVLAQHKVVVEITEEIYDAEKGELFVPIRGTDHRLEQLAEKIAREFTTKLDDLASAYREVTHRRETTPPAPPSPVESCRNARVWVLTRGQEAK